jgi:hypothetical protein
VLGSYDIDDFAPSPDGGSSVATTTTTDAAMGDASDAGDQAATSCDNLASDPKNCGTCGHNCLGGSCVAGACQPVVVSIRPDDSLPTVASLVARGGAVYYTDYVPDGGHVWKQQLSGGDPVALASDPSPRGLVVDDQYVFWTSTSANAIYRVPIGGGKSEPLALNQDAHMLAADADHLYWSSEKDNVVRKIAKIGGAGATDLSNYSTPREVAVDETAVYFSIGVAVMSVPLDGGTLETVKGGYLGTNGLSVANGFAYVCDPVLNAVSKINLKDQSATAIANARVGARWCLADGAFVYFIEGTTGGTLSRAHMTGRIDKLATATHITAIATDATSVYWAAPDVYSSRNETRIYRLAK